MPDISHWLSFQERSRRNARRHLALIRRERADAVSAQALLAAAPGLAHRMDRRAGSQPASAPGIQSDGQVGAASCRESDHG